MDASNDPPNAMRWAVRAPMHRDRSSLRPLQISKQPGETIYKGHRSYDLMLNLQLGIRFTVGRINSKPAPIQLSDLEFRRTVCSTATSATIHDGVFDLHCSLPQLPICANSPLRTRHILRAYSAILTHS